MSPTTHSVCIYCQKRIKVNRKLITKYFHNFYVRDRALRISFIMAENKLGNKGAWQSIRQIYIRFLFLEYLLWIIYVMYANPCMHMEIPHTIGFSCDISTYRFYHSNFILDY